MPQIGVMITSHFFTFTRRGWISLASALIEESICRHPPSRTFMILVYSLIVTAIVSHDINLFKE